MKISTIDNLVSGVALLIIAMVTVGVLYGLRASGYRSGQIDALQGKVYFELRLNSKGETVWYELVEPKSTDPVSKSNE